MLFISCARHTKENKDCQTVKIDTVIAADKQKFLQFPGRVKAAQDISLSFRVSGTINKIYVKDGAQVRAGQLLAELDPTDYQVQLDATEAEYRQVKAEAERVMALYKENGTTPNANDKAVYGLKQQPNINIIKISWHIPAFMLLSADMYKNVCSKPMRP